jgi:putative endonuclease
MRAQDRRKRTYDAGRLAESLAVLALRVKGYRIVARRWRSRSGEVDIIALAPGLGRERTLAFIEVKRRDGLDAAAESVRLRQRRRIESAADAFVAAFPRFAATTRRFDLMLLAPRHWPRHVVDAWHTDDACV